MITVNMNPKTKQKRSGETEKASLLSGLWKLRKKQIIIAMLGVVLILICTAAWLLYSSWSLPNPSETAEINIQRGMTPKAIADHLQLHGVIPGQRRFLLAAKLLGITKKLQAGEYAFSGKQNLHRVLLALHKGHVISDWVTFPEGSRSTTIASVLKKRFDIDSTRFMSLVFDSSFCRSLNIDEHSLEGYLYPDTYRIQRQATGEEIIRQMVTRFFNVFDESFVERTKTLNATIHQIVTLASIVEGEAALNSERSIISALYWNRLQRGMRLQADPTIQYLIPDGPRRLLNRDLEIDSPYNTYLYSGLPPGPVNNPGRACLYSTLYPDSVNNVLYMVSNGDGSHTFSRSIRGHLEAKQRLDQLRRQLRRNR